MATDHKLKCIATDQPSNTSNGTLVVAQYINGILVPIAKVNADALAPAKTCRVTLTRDDADSQFRGSAFYYVETF
jgi:hypothetical protein